MKPVPFLLLALSVSLACALFSTSLAEIEEFEFIESVPVETTLDNEHIRNTYDVWLEMIEGARSKLDFEQFYVSDAPGEPLEDIVAAIVRAADTGVRVRFIVDSRMYETYPERLDWLGEQQNIEVRTIDMRNIAGGAMHAKYFIVDGEEIFLGSQNFDWRALKHIHEMGCRVKSQTLAEVFLDLFELDWQLAEEGTKDAGAVGAALEQYCLPMCGVARVPLGGGAFRLDSLEVWPVYSPAGLIPDERLWDENAIVALVADALEEVLVQLLSYSSVERGGYYEVLESALRGAAARGASVKLIVSDWSKRSPDIDCLKSLQAFPNVEVKLSTVPEWSGGFVPYARVEHCKYMVVDGKMFWLGTSNWKKNYFHEGRNVGLLVKSTGLSGTLRDVFYKSWNSEYTYPVKLDEVYVPPKTSE
ncbi:MAG: hypothetical protein JSW03_01945 [Candidatus Eiseniibacteriota bacterium]|nr:MAG: hypothetical protein JSW03_01945 [Candidatus Eisenbacteria bacterium]